jgi:hypothetical protein
MSDDTPSQILMRELGSAAETDLGWALIRYVKRWEETENPHWIDLAALVLIRADHSFPPTLLEIIAHVATRRLSGLESADGGASVMDEEIKETAFAQMASMVAKGATIREASGLAANTIAKFYGPNLLKASTLEKQYGRRRAAMREWEDLLRDAVSNDDYLEMLRQVRELPEQDPGERR